MTDAKEAEKKPKRSQKCRKCGTRGRRCCCGHEETCSETEERCVGSRCGCAKVQDGAHKPNTTGRRRWAKFRCSEAISQNREQRPRAKATVVDCNTTGGWGCTGILESPSGAHVVTVDKGCNNGARGRAEMIFQGVLILK